MLDEILERELCTYSLEENGAKWQYLRKRNTDNNFGGLTRAMTVVARGFITDCGGFNSGVTMDERIGISEDTRNYLKLWCGFLDGDERSSFINKFRDDPKMSELIFRSDGWFPRYLEAVHSSDRKNGKSSNIVKAFGKKKKSYSAPMFSAELEDSAKDDNKAISYDSIIADAFCGGPLKRRVLASTVDPTDILAAGNNNSRRNNNKKRAIYALTAHCMMNGKRPDGSFGFCVFVKAEMSNWVRLDRETAFRDADIEGFGFRLPGDHSEDAGREKTAGIFGLEADLVAGNTCKIRVSEDWIRLCGFELFETDENEAAAAGGVIGRDGIEYRVVFADNKETYA